MRKTTPSSKKTTQLSEQDLKCVEGGGITLKQKVVENPVGEKTLSPS